MPLDRHSILAVSTAKKLNTPLKASVVLLTAVILASCSTSGGDNSIAPKPTPVLPGVEDGETGGGETGGGETGGGETGDDTAAIKAAEARAKDAEAKAVIAESQTKIAQTKLAEATKALDTAKKDAQEKIDALENASKSEINAAKKAAQTAQDALKTAEETFKVESSKAVAAAKAEAAEAKIAAEAARAEAVAKIEAAAKASKSQVDLAKKAAAEAVEKVKVAEDKAKEAEVRAKTAIEAAEARVKAAEAIAKTESEKAKQEANAKVTAEAKAKAAEEAKTEAEKATVAAETARAKAEAAKLEAEKALEEVLANGGGSEALQKEAERKAKLAEQAQAQAQEAQAVAQAAQQAAAAQVAAAQQAQQAAEAALAAAAIKNAPEATKSGVQSLNIDPSAAGLPNAFIATSRDFNTTANSVEARADTASGGLLPIVNITTSGTNDTNLQNGFKSHDDSTDITTALGVLPLTYTSTYKDFGDDMRIGHIDGAAALGANKLPVNGVAVVGNATQAANMPTEGKVGYTGDATYRKLGIGNDIEFGKSVFTADFVAQNVKGDLTFDKAGKIGLTAGINGNQFSGTAADNAGYSTEGGFFGGDAQYLGGVYEGKGAQGTYGAKSDKQTAAEKAADKAQADVKTAQAATAAAQAQAAAAQAAADKAKADATKAQEALVAAEEALANAGNGENQLAAALERAAAAEAAEEAALEAAETAKNARAAAETAKIAAETAAKAAKDAADKAIGEAKVEADKKVAAANQQVADAKVRADKAEIDANTAKAAEAKAKTEAAEAKAKADIAVKAANAKTDLANQQAADAQAQAQTEKQKAAAAQAEADKAKGELVTAQADLAAAEKALADALASGGGNTEALQAEVDRRQAALDAANAKIIATEQAQAQAAAAAAAQVAAAQSAQQAAEDALAAAKIKNAPEAEKSGAQSINVGTSVAGLPDFVVTTRDFEIGENNVIARADVASGDLLPKVDVNISGEGDTELANGFKSHDDNTSITTALGELPLEYTSVYKDYGNDMRVGHIDGAANLQGTDIPVNGVAVVGNATQAANMPTEGKVGYTGDATYRKLGIGNDIEFGKSVFTADFVAQNVKGDLTFDKAGKIGLTAGINGNQFSGTAADNAGYSTEGGFFGGDAQYLGGVYEGKGAQGTYGAKSDKQTAAEEAADKAQADADKAQAAIANANAQAAAAQAAAEKAKADATKAQEALTAAEEALANAGTGDGGLAAALARAEAAEGAALEAASTADAARIAAQTAQMAAEQAQISAEKVAEKAVGDAQAQKEAKEKALQAQAVAESAKAVAEAAKIEAENAKTEALNAKVSAEAARDEAIARAEAAEAEALEAANKFTAPDSRVSGFQSTSVGSDDGIFDNNSNSYNQLKVYANEVDGRASLKPIDVKLRGANNGAADNTYGTGNNGFKEHKGSTSFEGRLGGTIHKRDMNYSSVYKNFDNQMQIGHLEGDIKNGILYKSHLSNTYVQGNATNLGDMDKLANVNEGKANYEGVATYAEGGKIAVDGTSKFDVDFVAKSVKGELDFADKQVDINATISNNTFASEQGAAVNTVGGFYGKGASLLGGVYERETKDNYIKGTYGASKIDPTVEVVPDPTESKMTGFQSTALSSKEKTLPLGQGQLDNAIGYVEIRDDKSAWTELKIENGSEVPVDNRKGDNFTSFSKGKVLADMVKPDTVLEPITVNLTAASGEQKVEAGRGSLNPTYQYNAVYKNFDSQMQVGHVYGNLNSIAGDVSRAANVYVEGYLTSQAGMESLKNVNAGKAQYQGMATYIENIHLADNASTAPVNGTSAFNVDFVSGSVDGTLSFTGTGYKYMPAGNEIKIDADITGNTFAGNKNGIDTAGGFYGKEAQFLGGIYQDASVPGGSGDVAGTGTKFQGTFGAEKQ
ncbi:transferrin-binding protein-like solute binding protein [Psychrobacter sp. AT9]|uniref:transferrin-binding protein-like solute binding protein n=1 Tax=Psychrobacter sp. AT9 TaxID=3242893 RepID=UPI0039A76EB2